MHRLFKIDHLVHEICSHATNLELSVLARVSSMWFQYAISHLYRSIRMEYALAPLGKTVIVKNSTKKFVKMPRHEDFQRLWKYTPYVRTLRIDPSIALVTLYAMRKSVSGDLLHLFPNVRHLIWDKPEYSTVCMDVSVGLISSKLDQLTLYIRDEWFLHYFCPLVMTRMPALRFLLIQDHTRIGTAKNLPGPSSTFAKPVQDLMTFYKQTLTTAELPLSLNTPSIVQCLSKVSSLRNLKIEGCDVTEDEKTHKCGNRGGFISLHSLWFDGSLRSFNNMFLNPHGLTSLETLSTRFVPDDIGTFISSLVVSCPHMKSLSVGDRRLYDATYTWPVAPWQSIESISCLKDLSCLSLHGMRFSITLEELTKFLKSRKTWKCFHLLSSVPLRLQDMLLYAKHCPELEHLGIYISDISEFYVGDDLPTFPVLKSIDFAGSKITFFTSRILAQFLHRTCKKPLGSYQLRGLSNNVTKDVLERIASFTSTSNRDGATVFVKMMVKKQ